MNYTERLPKKEQISPVYVETDHRDREYSAPYYARVIGILEYDKGLWNRNRVGIFKRIENGEDEQIGEYIRNYTMFGQTFYPFERNGKWYALYSKDYTCTAVMTLPDCKTIYDEKPDDFGFCPVEFYVPLLIRYPKKEDGTYDYNNPYSKYASYGFVSGCVWGDDSSWKVQFLDLSKIEEGVVIHDDRMGYVELPPQQSLADAVSWATDGEDGPSFKLAVNIEFETKNGKMVSWPKICYDEDD